MAHHKLLEGRVWLQFIQNVGIFLAKGASPSHMALKYYTIQGENYVMCE